jgi:hypothetical protein
MSGVPAKVDRPMGLRVLTLHEPSQPDAAGRSHAILHETSPASRQSDFIPDSAPRIIRIAPGVSDALWHHPASVHRIKARTLGELSGVPHTSEINVEAIVSTGTIGQTRSRVRHAITTRCNSVDADGACNRPCIPSAETAGSAKETHHRSERFIPMWSRNSVDGCQQRQQGQNLISVQ